MKNRSKYIAAAAQLGPINPEDSKESVISRMLNLLVEAKAHETKLVVFPELCLTTFFPRYYITDQAKLDKFYETCLLYTSPSPRDRTRSRMPSSA